MLSWISLDHKCSDSGCWYCNDRCHNCFKPANAGYTKKDGYVAYKHCSELCKLLHFGNLSEIPFQADVINVHINTSLIGSVLLRLMKVVSTDLSVNTLFNIWLCLSQGHPRIPNGAPFVLLQVRTIKSSNFFSFFYRPGYVTWRTSVVCQ